SRDMKLNPQQAPLYGRCVITVQLADEEQAADDEGVDYFLLFAGSTQRHLTTTLRSSHDTLQALCPAHDCCEVVLVTLCSVTRGVSEDPEPCLVRVAPLAEHRFSFVQDLAFDMAQFLVSTAGRADGLDGALLLDECQIPLQECERLDESLALALHHLVLPPGWSLLGNKLTNSTDLSPQETLLHFSARRGLFQVTHFWLQQPRAKEALRLANRQGHTPSAIAALRGHECLLELLTKAETDTEKEKETETVQLVSTDARIVCHLPRLNTHTLTLSIHPGRDPPTLQTSVEQLLHLIRHLHAKGVSVLELQFDSLHTASECCDGAETEITCLERLQQSATESECLDTATGGSGVGNCSVESKGSVDCGHGETGSEGPQSKAEGESLTVGILPPAGCGKQAEETDRGEAVIWEGQEATKGKERSEQETEDCTATRREEETNLESTDLVTPSGDTKASVMGQTPSSQDSEVSDTSDSEMKEYCQEGEHVGKEEMKLSQELCDRVAFDEEMADSEGLTEPVSTPGDLPNPLLIDCGDVIEEPESAVPRLLIEGLHEGEPPPDINSLEQNQETAGRDYAAEQQWGLAPETCCHSEICTGAASGKELDGEDAVEISGCSMERTSSPMDEPDNTADSQTAGNTMKDSRTDPSSELLSDTMAISSNRHADLDSGMTHGLSSDDDGSFRSVGSSTTEIFHPTQDNASMEDQDLLQNKILELSSTESRKEEPSDSKPSESNEHSLIVDAGLPLEPGTFSTLTGTDCSHTGTEPESQLSPSLQTMEALNLEGIGEKLAPELSKEDLSFGPALSESGDAPTVKVDESETGEANESELKTMLEDSASEVTNRVLFELSPSIPEGSEAIGPVEGDHWSTECRCAAASSEKQSKHDNLELTADERSPDEESRQSENQTKVASSQSVTPLPDSDDVDTLEVAPPAPNAEAFSEPNVENDMSETPRTLDAVDGASESHNNAIQEVEVFMSEETVIGAGEEENGPPEETDFSTCFERIVPKHIKDIIPAGLDQYQFAYRENRSTEDAVSIALHTALTHLQLPNTYVRMLFVDFISAFNTVIPDKLILKLHNLGLPSSLCHWFRDFLSQQASGDVRICGTTHPLHCDCSAIHSTNTIVKFADDTTVVGLISDNDETHYREEIQHLTQWCSNNNLVLNTSKTKEVIVDYRRSRRTEHAPLLIHGEAVERVNNIKFLGIHITSDLTWSMNTAHLCLPVSLQIHRDREASFHQPYNTQHSGSSQSSVSPSFPSRTSSATSCPSTAHRDSGSDIESFLNAEAGYDSVFRKLSSPEGSQGLECSWSPEEGIQTGTAITAGLDSGGVAGGSTGEAEEEAKDRVTEVPRRSCLLRNSIRSLSPLRRHSWGPGKNNGEDAEMNQRSYSLEGLSGGQEELRGPTAQGPRILEPSRMPRHDSDDRGSLVSLTEEQEELGEHGRLHDLKSRRYRPLRNSCPPMTLPLTKSVSMLAISQRDIDGMRSFSSASGSLAYSISEEEPGPLRSDTEGKSTKVSRTFSYLKNKMYKKTREKDREKKEKDKEGKEKDKKVVNGHLFTPVSAGQVAQCFQCNKAFSSKEAFHCTHCNASVHKGCRDSLPVCAKVKMKLPKQQFAVPDSSSFPTVTMRNKSGGTRERPWSAILSPDDHSSLMIPSSRRHTSIMTFHGNNLSKSLSISNIAGPVFDEMPIKGLRYLSQSTDSLNRTNQVTESMESLTDEGTEMMDGQLMGEFEAEAKELEADSWSLGVEPQYLHQLDKELVKRQDVFYELMQTEMHHIRTLRIMSEVYNKGLQKEVQLEQQTVEKLFPALDELLELHTQHLLRLLERKRESQLEGGSLEGGFIINRIGDILVSQFSGSNGESMKRIYGRFCSRHTEAVNFYKDLMTKDKRFKAFIRKKMSSSIVRRLGIPECILLVTQRITKYPVLIQRMLQHTKESDDDFDDLTEAVRLVKEVIAAVDSKVNEHEKRRRLKEFHSRMDSKSIMMMKSGQIFAREDLLRRKLIHDGVLQLKNSQGRLKDVHALLLSDVFVFLQEKDQKYVFAMLDQRSTVISLQKLIVREVANEERGLFLITAGIEKPEMMEVLASSKDERNTWMQLIQEAMQSMEKDEDEGIPSENEDDKRQLETKAKEMRDLLRQKDTEIMSLLEEKMRLFRGMWEGLSPNEEVCRQAEPFFRSACSQELPRGASVMKDALQEVETLQALVNGSLGGAMASVQEGGGAGPVCLPRRAETFGGFDSHQMHSSGDRDESEDAAGDLRRTESDSVLKKGGNANLLLLLKRNSEAVVVQQDSFIEDQRQALSERSSSCTSLSRPSSRPSSLIEQEKQRSLEKQRQELASLQRQQAAHAEEKRRREKEWELREQQLSEREVLVNVQEEEVLKQHKELENEKQELLSKKEEYQKDLERLRDAQRKLERDREAVQRHLEKMDELRLAERTPSTTSDEFPFPSSSQSLELDPLELSPSSSSSLPRLQPQRSKPKGKGLNPFTSSSTQPNLKGSEAHNQISKSLLQLAKNKSKEGKEKKKKKCKGGSMQTGNRNSG
ncbi:hypothetical protein L3Q82_008812, partial [Scortum barcoo]